MSELPRRLLILVHRLDGGGGERQLVTIASGLAALGWDVHVVTMSSGGRYWTEVSEAEGVALQSLERGGRWDFSVLPRCVEYIVKHRIGIVQGWMQPCNTFAAIAGMLARRPVAMGVRTISSAVLGAGPRLYMHSEPLLARWSRAAIVCNSEAALDEWRRHTRLAQRLVHIPNCLVPPGTPFPPPLGHRGPVRIGMLARLDPIKGHELMLHALAQLRRRGVDVRFVNWGSGSPEQVAQLRGLARALEIGDLTEFRSPCDTPWEALASIDIFVSASHAEGMSNSLMEAMAAGRIIVATDVGDTAAMLRGGDGACGFLAAPDATSLADALAQALSNPDAALAGAANAARHAAASFSVPRAVAAYARLYERMLRAAAQGA